MLEEKGPRDGLVCPANASLFQELFYILSLESDTAANLVERDFPFVDQIINGSFGEPQYLSGFTDLEQFRCLVWFHIVLQKLRLLLLSPIMKGLAYNVSDASIFHKEGEIAAKSNWLLDRLYAAVIDVLLQIFLSEFQTAPDLIEPDLSLVYKTVECRF